MQTLECFKFRSKIFNPQISAIKYIGLATYAKNIKIFSLDECKVQENLYFDFLGKKTTAIAFHPTLSLMAIANETKLYIINLIHKDIIQTIPTHDGDISKLLFLHNTPYLLSATTNGRVMQYRYDGKTHISRLCSFPYSKTIYRKKITNNYVSSISYNSEYIACSGYGGAVTLVKFNSHSRKFSFDISKTRVNAIAFLNNNRIIFANVEGNIYIAKIRKNASISQINTSQRGISQIIPIENTNFAFIIAKSTNIMLFDIENEKILQFDFLQFDKTLKHVLLQKNSLLCTFSDNSIIKTTLTNELDIVNEIKRSNLVQAFELLESNPMLNNSQVAKKLQQLYTALYRQSFLEFIKTGKTKALSKLKEFEKLKSKKNDLEELRKAYVHYSKLQLFYKEHKYSLAYALCEKFPPLQYTPEYTKMEEYYKKSFTLAQKQLLLQRPQTAKELLEPFSTVTSKRAMIQLLLKQNKAFLNFLRAVSKKDYEQVATLVKITPTFQEIPSYIILMDKLKEDLKEIENFIYNAQIDKAVQKIKELQKISIIKEELLRLYNLSQDARKLISYYEKENFIQCYETLDANIELEVMQLAKLLEKHWNKIVNKCEVFALAGDIKAIKDTFGELIHVNSRKNKIGDILRLSFQSKIKHEIYKLNYKSSENLIYSYIDIFGTDSEMQQIIKSFEKNSQIKLAITLNQKKHKDRNSWSYSTLFENATL